MNDQSFFTSNVFPEVTQRGLNGNQLDSRKHSENMEQVPVQASDIGALCGQRLGLRREDLWVDPKGGILDSGLQVHLCLSTCTHS